MPDEQRLRDLLAGEPVPGDIDARAVIRRSRSRRLPKQLAAGSIGALAVLGIGVLGVQSLTPPPQTAVTMEQDNAAPAESLGAEDGIKRAPADKLNLCEAPIAEPAPSRFGLQLDVAFAASAPATGAPVVGAVRLTNTSASRVTGTTGTSPAITVSQGGIVLWHSNGPADAAAVVVDLEPGQSLEYAASFTPVRCAAEDDTLERFRPDLAPLASGDYELSAAIDFSPDPAMNSDVPDLDLVTSPRSPVVLR